MDALSLAIPFVSAIGGIVFRAATHGDEFVKLARLVDKSSEAILMARKMEYVRETGRISETLAGIVKNTKHIDSFSGKARYRIPDVLDKDARIIREVKNNGGKLGYSSQLQDYVLFAKNGSFTFELIVRESTKFTKALQKEINEGLITVIRSLP